jgi:hypothetical protein
MTFLIYYFWVGPHILLAGVIWSVFRRGMHRLFPFFSIYIVYDLIAFFILFTLYAVLKVPTHQYRAAGVWSTGLGVPLKVGVLYELSKDLLRNSPRSVSRLGSWLRWSFAVVLLAAAAASATQAHADTEKLQNVFLSLELLWSVLFCGVVVVLFASTHRNYWGTYGAGIAFGFGVFAAVNLATSAFRAGLGRNGNLTISIIQMAGYHACVLIWLIYLWLPEQKPPLTGWGLQKANLEAWNEQLQKIVR